MQFVMPNLVPVMPEIVLTLLTLCILMADLVIKRKETIALMSVISVGVVAYLLIGSFGTTFNGMYVSDAYSTFFKFIFLLNVILTVLISMKYIEIEKVNFGEYYILILFATIGMMLMASAGDLIVLYVRLELMALGTYVLAGFIRYDMKSNEAAVKYMLLGAFASAFLLYGTSMIYGLTGTTDIKAISAYIVQSGLASNPVLTLSMILFGVAFSFKIAAVPFHMWVPERLRARGARVYYPFMTPSEAGYRTGFRLLSDIHLLEQRGRGFIASRPWPLPKRLGETSTSSSCPRSLRRATGIGSATASASTT